MTKRMIQILAAGMLSLLAVGCQQSDKPRISHGENFPEEGQKRQIQRFVDGEVRNGARANATLHAYHFDGATLNSLGAQKLLNMIEANNAETPLVVYLDVLPDDKLSAARRDAAGDYLKGAGLHAEQYTFVYGINPNDKTFAAPEIVNLPKADSTADTGSTGGAVAGGHGSSGK